MKNSTKLVFHLMSVICIFGITSCEKDLYEDTIHNENIKVKKISLSQINLSKANVISEKIEKLKNKKLDVNGRFVYNSTLNIYVDVDNGIEVDKEGKITYTFPVFSEMEEKLENIVFSEKENNEFDTFLIKYDINKDDFLNANEEEIENMTPEISKVIYQSGNVILSYECIESAVVEYEFNMFSNLPYSGIQGTSPNTVFTYRFCFLNYDINIDDDTGGNSGGGGNTGGLSTSPIGGVSGSGPKDPCKDLKIMKNIKIIGLTEPKTVGECFTQLTQNTNLNYEIGFWTQETTNNEEVVQNFFYGQPGSNSIDLDVGNSSLTIFMHTHYDTVNQLSVFSLQDLHQIYTLIKNQNITGDFTAVLVTEHGTRYALKFYDSNVFASWGDFFFAGWEFDNLRDKKEDLYIKDVNPKFGVSKNENGFLKFVKNNNLGFELYKTDNDFTNWTKIVLDNNNITKPIPCSN